jgi:hypothetical protein
MGAREQDRRAVQCSARYNVPVPNIVVVSWSVPAWPNCNVTQNSYAMPKLGLEKAFRVLEYLT